MRYFEITSGVRIPISQEEQDIIDRITDTGILLKSDLDERDREVARKMVTRGLLNRSRDDDNKVVFKLNKVKLKRN